MSVTSFPSKNRAKQIFVQAKSSNLEETAPLICGIINSDAILQIQRYAPLDLRIPVTKSKQTWK